MLKKIAFIIIFIAICLFSLFVGVYDLRLTDLINGNKDSIDILFYTRIPRMLSVLISGASLAVCGHIMQTMTSNKFVSPQTAGTNDFCKLGVVIAVIFFHNNDKMTKIIVAFIIALLGNILFMTIIQKIRQKDSVLVPLVGMMLGSVVAAFTAFATYKLDITQNVSSWMQGDFSLVIKGSYELIFLGIPFFVLCYLYASKFTIIGMGESFATNLGINHKKITLIGLAIVSIIVTVIVVNVGSIAFVGLIIPNIISKFKGDNLKMSISTTAFLGGLFLLVCDVVSRVINFPYEIPINMIVSVIGGVVFLGILFKRSAA